MGSAGTVDELELAEPMELLLDGDRLDAEKLDELPAPDEGDELLELPTGRGGCRLSGPQAETKKAERSNKASLFLIIVLSLVLNRSHELRRLECTK